MTPRTWRRRPREHGQTLVLFVIALVALFAATGLIVDGGNAFAQQRATQNAADAAANAGSVVLLQDLVAAYDTQSLPNGDAAVLAAVDQKAAQNGIAVPTAYYTTINGTCITAGGGTAAPPCTGAANAVQVGSGSIPTVGPDGNGQPQCPPLPSASPSTPTLACGVAVYGSKTFGTFVAGAIGIRQLSTSAAATAISGVLTTICPADVPCEFLPLTFPTLLTTCDNTGKQLSFGNAGDYTPVSAPYTAANESIIGICSSGAGTVGWLAITPEDGQAGWAGTTSCGGGTNDLVCDIEYPDNPPLSLPVWLATESGNTNNTGVDTAVNGYDGQTVIIPLYDCVGSNETQTSTDTCAQASVQQGGSNLSFHIVGFTAFLLDHAYIQSSNPQCQETPGSPPVGGNGSTGCLKGWITNYAVPSGTLGLGTGSPTSVFGVQLIR